MAIDPGTLGEPHRIVHLKVAYMVGNPKVGDSEYNRHQESWFSIAHLNFTINVSPCLLKWIMDKDSGCFGMLFTYLVEAREGGRSIWDMWKYFYFDLGWLWQKTIESNIYSAHSLSLWYITATKYVSDMKSVETEGWIQWKGGEAEQAGCKFQL